MATPQQMNELARQPVLSRQFHQGKPSKPLPPLLLQRFIISFKLSDTQLKRDAKVIALEFATAAYDREGVLLSSVVEAATVEDSNQKRQAVHGVQQRILVPLSATSLRVGVEDRITSRLGSLEVSLPLAPGQ